MLALLDRADNETCEIPNWLSPSLLAVQKDTSLGLSTVKRTLAHLELHGWLRRDGQKAGQVAGSKNRGRKQSTTRWALLPNDMAGLPCLCPKPDRPTAGQSSTVEIGRERADLDRPSAKSGKWPSPAEIGRSAPRDYAAREGGGGVCFKCGKKARRSCRTCWEHAGLEMSA